MQRRRWLCRATVGTGCSGRRPSIVATMLPQTDAPNMRTHKHQSCLPSDTQAASLLQRLDGVAGAQHLAEALPEVGEEGGLVHVVCGSGITRAKKREGGTGCTMLLGWCAR